MLYETFLDNFKGNPEQQKVAYEAGKDYFARYQNCPKESDKNIVAYIGSGWAGTRRRSESRSGESRQPDRLAEPSLPTALSGAGRGGTE